jgi:hypothetical protein
MTATRQGLKKFRHWMSVVREQGYDEEDRRWFADFWWERHDDDGNLYRPGVRRSSAAQHRSPEVTGRSDLE